MESQSEFQGNQEHIESQQIYKEPKKQMNYESSVNSGPWTDEQNLKYIIFVDRNRQSLTSRSKRRVNKIFKEMSQFIGKRNAIQCRSHHQKQLDKLKNISKIIQVFKKAFDHDDYDKKAQQIISMSLNATNSDSDKDKREFYYQNQLKADVQVQTNIAGVDLKLAPENYSEEKRVIEPISYDFHGFMGIPNIYNLNGFPFSLVDLWGLQFYGKKV